MTPPDQRLSDQRTTDVSTGARAFAALLDVLAFAIAVVVIGCAALPVADLAGTFVLGLVGALGAIGVGLAVARLVSTRGVTPGAALRGLQIRDASTGELPSFGRAALFVLPGAILVAPSGLRVHGVAPLEDEPVVSSPDLVAEPGPADDAMLAEIPAPLPAPAPRTEPVDAHTRRAPLPAPPTPAAPPPGPDTRGWALVDDLGRAWPLEGETLVGRDPDPALHPGAGVVQIDDPARTVSKSHALVGLADHRLWVEDLDSTNGVAVISGGVEHLVDPRTRTDVAEGDQIVLGDYLVTVRRALR